MIISDRNLRETKKQSGTNIPQKEAYSQVKMINQNVFCSTLTTNKLITSYVLCLIVRFV